MPLREYANKEELTRSVHALVFDGDIAPVLYRVRTLFGNGAKLESVHFEVPLPDRLDLMIVTLDPYAINITSGKRAVTVKYADGGVKAPQTVEQVYQLQLSPTLGFVVSIENKTAIRICMQGHRQLVTITLNRMEAPSEFRNLQANSFIVAPFRARQLDYMIFACQPRNSAEFKSPGEVLNFLEPLYSTACGAILAAIKDATDTTSHPTTWTSPDLNAFPVLAVFRLPISKKSGWAVGHAIRGAYMADFMDGQITQIEMGEENFQMEKNISSNFTSYLGGTSKPRPRDAGGVGLVITVPSRYTRWKSVRALLAGDIDLEGTDNPNQ
ncbi:unnamed protein product, partial [Strongylus vulgaris]